MGTIPVANPSPPRRLRFPRRGLAIALTVGSAAGVLVVAAVFAWPTGPKVDPAGWVTVGKTGDFAVIQPVRFPEERFWLVKLDSGEFLALWVRDPHLGCTVPWREEFEFMGVKGWFRNPCHNETYNVNGECVFGPCSRGLDRFPVRIENGEVQVLADPRQVIAGPPLGRNYRSCNFNDPFWVTNC